MIAAALLWLGFVVFTILVRTVDVQDIGPDWSSVGFARLNAKMYLLFDVNESAGLFWYKMTEGMGIFAIIIGLCFAGLGLAQLIKGRSLKAVDADIYALGGFYVCLAVVYVLFEKLVINYRPVLEDGELAASYPSSHTVLIVGIMMTTILQLSKRLAGRKLCRPACISCAVLAAVAVIGRLLAGVHWFTDIVGGLILAAALVVSYEAAVRRIS